MDFGGAPTGPPPAGGMDIDDPELAAAIEASYRAQTGAGREANEDELLAQALELSRLEEEARQRGEHDGAARGDDSTVADMLFDDDASAVPSEGAMPIPTGARGGFAAENGLGPAPAGGWSSFDDRGGPIEPFPDDIDAGGFAGDDFGGLPRDTVHRAPAEDEMHDAHLAMALEASYNSQTTAGMQASEEDLIQQAIMISQREEESRQRASLREQQEQELQESVLMDRMREEEEKRKLEEERQLRDMEARAKREEEERVASELAEKKSRVPPEPAADQPGRVDVMIRLRDGQRLRRFFLGSNTVGQIYDYLDTTCGEEFAKQSYRLVSTMPRRAYEERDQDLASAGLQGQCALLVEAIQGD
mmetsp:Transcript_1898/g.4457  ORF Transcript_1898/g.4457 Transcript_1898/m.4457 type:complete len:361 (+) Transcript_1898:78-1160(+)